VQLLRELISGAQILRAEILTDENITANGLAKPFNLNMAAEFI
jgi:hypothetical protein